MTDPEQMTREQLDAAIDAAPEDEKGKLRLIRKFRWGNRPMPKPPAQDATPGASPAGE